MFTSGNGDRPNSQNIALITTDGRSNDRNATWTEAVALRRAGTHVITVGTGQSVYEPELRDMASFDSESNVFVVQSFNDLATIKSNLVETICNSKLVQLTYSYEFHYKRPVYHIIFSNPRCFVSNITGAASHCKNK